MNTTVKIYNGYSIRDILGKMPEALRAFKPHRNLYIKNCIEVYFSERSGTNLNFAQCIRNTNFNLIKMYNNLND